MPIPFQKRKIQPWYPAHFCLSECVKQYFLLWKAVKSGAGCSHFTSNKYFLLSMSCWASNFIKLDSSSKFIKPLCFCSNNCIFPKLQNLYVSSAFKHCISHHLYLHARTLILLLHTCFVQGGHSVYKGPISKCCVLYNLYVIKNQVNTLSNRCFILSGFLHVLVLLHGW